MLFLCFSLLKKLLLLIDAFEKDRIRITTCIIIIMNVEIY